MFAELLLDDDEIKNYALVETEKLLRNLSRSLRDFPSMSFLNREFFGSNQNRLIMDELRYDRKVLKDEYEQFIEKCTDEQRRVHDTVLSAIDSNSGSQGGEIVLNVASNGITLLLLPGGRTAHSRFKIPKIPINLNEDLICNIKQGSELADLIIRVKLIIWDEAPMMHKFCFEALDTNLRDIMRFSSTNSLDVPFGGKTIVFGGDFRQILPVIPKGSRRDIVHATINSSYLWKHYIVLRLTKNMRLRDACTNDESIELEQFAKWVASIGDETIGGPNDGETSIELPDDIVVKYSGNPIEAIVQEIYSSPCNDVENSSYLQERAILAPILSMVESINQHMVTLNKSEGRQYLSSDSTCTSESGSSLFQDIHTPEFLNTLQCSVLPNHELYLKVGTPVILLRNIDYANSLCNSTRLVVTRLGNHVLEDKVSTGQNARNKVLILRMTLTPSDPRLLFKFQRKQFPVDHK